MKKSLIQRFEEKYFVAPDGCWLWTANADRDGYGKISVSGIQRMAHRVSYEIKFGVIPMGMQIDHLCKQRSCVNPHHLDAVTLAENNRRKSITSRCQHGVGVTKCVDGCWDDARKEYHSKYMREYRKRVIV